MRKTRYIAFPDTRKRITSLLVSGPKQTDSSTMLQYVFSIFFDKQLQCYIDHKCISFERVLIGFEWCFLEAKDEQTTSNITKTEVFLPKNPHNFILHPKPKWKSQSSLQTIKSDVTMETAGRGSPTGGGGDWKETPRLRFKLDRGRQIKSQTERQKRERDR